MRKLTGVVVVVLWLVLLAAPAVAARPDDAPPAPAPAPGKSLTGEWQTGNGVKVFTYTFAPGGTYELRIEAGERLSRGAGTWTYENDVLTIASRRDPDPLRLGVEWIDEHYIDTFVADSPKMPRIRWVRRAPTAPKEGELTDTWVINDPAIEWKLDLREDGTYAMTEGTGATQKLTRGTWRRAPAALVMRLDDDPEKEFTWNLRFLDADHVDFTDEHVDSGDLPWRRLRAAPPSPEPTEPTKPVLPEPAAGPEALVGKWFVGDEGMSVSLTLNADKTFLHILKSKTSKETTRGTWRVEGNILIGDPEDEDVAYRLRYKFLDKNRLELYDETEKETSVLQREGTQPGPADLGPLTEEAKAMVGEWLARSEEVEIRLSLGADGAFMQVIRKGKDEKTMKGRFNLKDGDLLALPEGAQAPVRLQVRLIDPDTLEVADPAGGGTTELVRQKK